MIRAGAGLVVGLAMGFLAARALPGGESRAMAPAPAAGAPPEVTCVATLRAADLAALRAELRDALRADPAAPANAAAAEPVAAPEPPSEAQVAAAAEAHTLIDRGIAAGTWTAEDALQLRRLLTTLPPEERAQATGALIRAINEQRVALATHTPL